jgi:cytochrome P450
VIIRAITRNVRSGIPAERFCPDRFLSHKVSETDTDPAEYAFGFGRRLCPGKHLGMNNLILLAGGLLKSFHFSPVLDRDGNMIPLDPEYTSGLVRYIDWFSEIWHIS